MKDQLEYRGHRQRVVGAAWRVPLHRRPVCEDPVDGADTRPAGKKQWAGPAGQPGQGLVSQSQCQSFTL